MTAAVVPVSDDPGLLIPRLGPYSVEEHGPTLGWEAIDWIETFLRHGPGDVQGDPILLDPEFANFVLWAYRLRPDGRRHYRRAFLSRPKGRAKSELAGALSVFEFAGPCRLDGFDAHGRPVGRELRSPFVRNLATEESQAGNTYDNVFEMTTHAREEFPAEFAHVSPGLTRTTSSFGGEVRPSSAASASKDGGRESFVVFDETHLYVLDELRRMYRTVSRNLAKRKAAQPWALETSTMFALGEGSQAEATYDLAAKIATGILRTQTVLVDHRQAGEIDWDDDEQVLAALVDVYGDFAPNMDLEGVLAQIRDPENPLEESVRYFGNRAQPKTGTAFDPRDWAACAGDPEPPKKRTWIALGFDGARFHDATALVGATIEDGKVFVLGVWERPPNAPDDWEVPVDEVDAAVAAAFTEYRVARFYADPPYWEEQVDAWAGRYGPKKVARWWTHRDRAMAHAIRAFRTAIAGRDLSHDGDPILAAHVGNARRRETKMRDDEGKPLWTVRKENPSSPRKIDAAVAAILAWEARGDAIASGALKRVHAKAVGF